MSDTLPSDSFKTFSVSVREIEIGDGLQRMTKLSDPREELKTFSELRLIGVDVRQWITHLISDACLLLFIRGSE
jgi:hypothetical protein